MNWTGFYAGVHLGGGWSNDRWSDPFASTLSATDGVNAAGFGDITHGTGPLGGAGMGFNWQLGSLVFGLEANASGADLHGENTCFSGLGGFNCQRVVNALGTFTARAGYAWDRTLFYAKGGGAWADTTYDINANTNALKFGTSSTHADQTGWTIGGGVEYALTDHWSVLVEYDHMSLPGRNVAFPTVETIGDTAIAIGQRIDLFKLGLNYKLGSNGQPQAVAKY